MVLKCNMYNNKSLLIVKESYKKEDLNASEVTEARMDSIKKNKKIRDKILTRKDRCLKDSSALNGSRKKGSFRVSLISLKDSNK